MAVKKDEFVKYINNAILETKNIHDIVKKNTSKKESSNSIEDLEKDTQYMHNKYVERVSKAKLEKLYSILNNVSHNRIMNAEDNEIELYKENKIEEINAEINRLMILLETKDESFKSSLKDKIKELMDESKSIKNESIDDIRNKLSSKVINNSLINDEETEVLGKIYKDDKTLSKFFDLISEYRKLKNELKMLEAEKKIIIKDLVNNDFNFSIDNIDLDNILSDDGLEKLQKSIVKYIRKTQNEEDIENYNFSEDAKEAYIETLKPFNNLNNKPIDIEKINYFKAILIANAPRLYEKANLEVEEFERLYKKTFKTNDVEVRMNELVNEINLTKNELNKFLRNYYRDYYKNNDVYKPISSRINGKFVYALGYQNLDEFVEYGIWPSNDKIESIALTRKLNKKEAENTILKIELVKAKYANLYNNALIDKQVRLVLVKDKMTRLVGNWENPIILKIVDEKFSTKSMDEELLATNTGVKEAEQIVDNYINKK